MDSFSVLIGGGAGDGITFRNMYDAYNDRVYELEGHDPRDEAQVLARTREWDYSSDGPVALGTLSVRDRPVYGEHFDATARPQHGVSPISPAPGGAACRN